MGAPELRIRSTSQLTDRRTWSALRSGTAGQASSRRPPGRAGWIRLDARRSARHAGASRANPGPSSGSRSTGGPRRPSSALGNDDREADGVRGRPLADCYRAGSTRGAGAVNRCNTVPSAPEERSRSTETTAEALAALIPAAGVRQKRSSEGRSAVRFASGRPRSSRSGQHGRIGASGPGDPRGPVGPGASAPGARPRPSRRPPSTPTP